MGLSEKLTMMAAERFFPIYEKVKSGSSPKEIMEEVLSQADKAMDPFYKAIESEGSPSEQIEELGLGKKTKKGKKILVAYYTKHGSTSSVAQAIADQLAEGGNKVDLRPVANLEGEDISKYDAYVLGSAIYWAAMKENFVEFMSEHIDTLQEKPVALFSVCGSMQRDTDQNRERVEYYMTNSLKDMPEFKPVDIGAFPGKIEYDKMTTVEAMIMRTLITVSPLKSGDQRDMLRVSNWVDKIKDQL
jgi:menaquinone-dependent protoporphyrinogen oxidase